MANITKIIKEGLTYPTEDNKKSGIFILISVITSLFVSGAFILLFDSVLTLIKANPENTTAILSSLNAQVFVDSFYSSTVTSIILLIIAFIMIIFLCGYELKVLKWTLNKKEGLPSFDGIGRMFIDAIKVIIISIIYSIIPMICNQFSSILGTILGIIFTLFMVLGIAHMFYKDSFIAAFKINEIVEVMKKINVLDYIGTYILLAIISIIIVIVAAMIGTLVLVLCVYSINMIVVMIGIVILFALIFAAIAYISIMSSRVYGNLYLEGVE